MAEPGVGLHLMIDGESTRKLRGVDLKDYITTCANAIGMQIIHGPIAWSFPTGWQALGVIATSHILVCALADKRTFIDVFSCEIFETHEPIQLARHILGLTKGIHAESFRRAGTGPV